MLNLRASLFIAVPVLLSGCASGPPFIDQMQPTAIDMAERRGAFEMNCPEAKGELLSRETLQPISFRFGYERAEYTIGVSGCGKRNSYVVICPDNGDKSCFAGASRVDSIQ
ncbi:MAG: hypothetical protein KDI17_09245 [Halioglobus sp.]|nr:hypothetical protein [Halioglobus sp.]